MIDRQTKSWLTTFCIVAIILLVLAGWGYWTGAWDSDLSPP